MTMRVRIISHPRRVVNMFPCVCGSASWSSLPSCMQYTFTVSHQDLYHSRHL
jgi:hypothetical protein